MKNFLERFIDSALIRNFFDALSHKNIPATRKTFWYFFGGLTLFFCVIQGISGGLLLIYYSPTPQTAHESIQSILTTVPYGWLIRSIHVWSAHLLITSLFIHFGAGFFMSAYRTPRESVWISGILLLFLILGFAFTGSLLPWDARAYFATQIGTEIPRSFPVLGPFVVRLLRGTSLIGAESLKRLFALHVTILPVISILLILFHLIVNHKHGPSIADTADGRNAKQIPFFPEFLLRDCIAWLTGLGILLVLALNLPPLVGAKADPFVSAPAGIKPEWYFFPLYVTLRMLPGAIMGLNTETLINILVAALGFAFLLTPFISHSSADRGGISFPKIAGAGILLYLLGTTIIGWILY
ncbi:MAG TPA: cytochrome bc complex cytochrome b subunit [Bacteroidota bacterium]|nr:cytochrome bc complex cytochrome b subunit [Bacteroidota bacterium]